MSITSTTGCMLISKQTGEKLPITSICFGRGGAVSEIFALEDDVVNPYDAIVLDAEYTIEFITCNRWSDLVDCPLCDGECDVVIDDQSTPCPACQGMGRVTPAHANKIKSDIKENN